MLNNLMKFFGALAALFLGGGHVASQSSPLLTVMVTANGQDVPMDLNRGESPLAAAVRFVNQHNLGVSVDPQTREPSQMTIQLAEVLLAQLTTKQEQNQRETEKKPIASFPVMAEGGQQLRFDHYEGGDIALEAQAFCQSALPDVDLGPCVASIVNGANQVMAETPPPKTERKVMLQLPINVNGQQIPMGIAEGEDATVASGFFCRGLNLGTEDAFSGCVDQVKPLAEAKIVEWMQEQEAARQKSEQKNDEPPLFEIPIQVGERILPLTFTLAENPATTTKRFCDVQWGYISTVLQSYEEGGEISKDLCFNTLYGMVTNMIDEMLKSDDGRKLVESQRLFVVPVQIETDQGESTLDLNVFQGQTANEAVGEFLRVNGIGEGARSQLVDLVMQKASTL
jgi:hypothetical protein